jgi:proton-dependent oligopeptide transporter, POT family
MKSVVQAIAQFQNALSSALNFALVSVNVEPKFMWLFASFAITSWVAGTVFFIMCVIPFDFLDPGAHAMLQLP